MLNPYASRPSELGRVEVIAARAGGRTANQLRRDRHVVLRRPRRHGDGLGRPRLIRLMRQFQSGLVTDDRGRFEECLRGLVCRAAGDG